MHVKRSMPATMLATVLALGGLAGVINPVEADVNVRHRLDVETGAGKVKVRVMIENRSDQPVWVPREIASADELTGPRFALRTPQENIPYIGKMVKRAAPGPDDYLEIKPHTTHLNTIDITGAYAFKPGRQSYEIRYAGPWLSSMEQRDAASIAESPSEPVRFSFTAGAGGN